MQCTSCSSAADKCIKCSYDRIKVPSCECPEGFYDDKVNAKCAKCAPKCISCKDNVTNCTECAANR